MASMDAVGGADLSSKQGREKQFLAMVTCFCCLLLLAAVLFGIYAGSDILTSDDGDDDDRPAEDRQKIYIPQPPASAPPKPVDGTTTAQTDLRTSTTPPMLPPQTQPPPVTSQGTEATSASEKTTSVTAAMSTDTTEPVTTTETVTAAYPTDATPAETTSAATTVSIGSTTPKPPGLPRFTLLCTVSYLHLGLVMPPADVCNYIFYDSLYLRPNDTFMGTFSNSYLKPFFDAANQTTNARFGLSVHAPAVDGFTNEVRSADGKNHYKEHWLRNVYGWGFLNIHELIVKSNPEVVKSALTVLKELEDIAVTEGKNASSMVIGLYCRPQTTCDQVADYFKTIFVPGGVVILGHISHRDNNLTECFILGPVLYNLTARRYANKSYVHTLEAAMTTVRYLQNHHGINTMYAVSFTLAGRWYKAKNPSPYITTAGRYRPGYPCLLQDHPQKAFVPEICHNASLAYRTNFYYAAHHHTIFGYDRTHGFSVTFDNPESLKPKVCSIWNVNTDLLTGLAVYDSNYDGESRNCTQYKGTAWNILRLLGTAQHMFLMWAAQNYTHFLHQCYLLNWN